MMCINATPDAPITVDGETLNIVEEFTYLGSLVSKDSSTPKDIGARLGKAHGARQGFILYGSQSSTASKKRSDCITAMSVLASDNAQHEKDRCLPQ